MVALNSPIVGIDIDQREGLPVFKVRAGGVARYVVGGMVCCHLSFVCPGASAIMYIRVCWSTRASRWSPRCTLRLLA